VRRLDRFDWRAVEAALTQEGQAVLRELLSGAECDALADLKQLAKQPPVQDLRAELYEKLVPIANLWTKTMGIETQYPARLAQLLRKCREAGQRTPQSAVVRLGKGQHRPLMQNAEGDYVFPLQVTVLLSQPDRDFTGGEIVMTEQRPRMQTRPMVVPLRRGDAAVFAVHHRPIKGSRGSYRVNLRHAVSPVRSGQRIALDFVFHDAP
jgi:uncharacterized protein